MCNKKKEVWGKEKIKLTPSSNTAHLIWKQIYNLWIISGIKFRIRIHQTPRDYHKHLPPKWWDETSSDGSRSIRKISIFFVKIRTWVTLIILSSLRHMWNWLTHTGEGQYITQKWKSVFSKEKVQMWKWFKMPKNRWPSRKKSSVIWYVYSLASMTKHTTRTSV